MPGGCEVCWRIMKRCGSNLVQVMNYLSQNMMGCSSTCRCEHESAFFKNRQGMSWGGRRGVCFFFKHEAAVAQFVKILFSLCVAISLFFFIDQVKSDGRGSLKCCARR